jgi:hypothetical protein
VTSDCSAGVDDVGDVVAWSIVAWRERGRIAHRPPRRGNCTLNSAIHVAAVPGSRHKHSESRVHFERKVAEVKTNSRPSAC